MSRRLRPHIPGLMYTALVMVVAIMAMNNQNNLMFWILGALVSGLVISALLSNLMIRSLRLRRIDPQHGTVGQPLIVRYAVRNHSRWLSAFNLQIEEGVRPDSRLLNRARTSGAGHRADAWIMHIGPRETVHGEAIFWPQRRGLISFNRLRASTTFPFGIIRKSRTVLQPQHTLVYPMMYELRPGLLRALAPKELIGTKVSHHAGAGDDFYGTREYRLGDSMRHIAWRRTARLDELITIERTSPSPARLRVILDFASIPHAGAGSPEKKSAPAPSATPMDELEERAISLAASILRAADLDGYEIGLTVLGLPLPVIAIRRNQWHFHKIMAALAGLDLTAPRLEGGRSGIGASVRDAERAALVVISPDRVRPLHMSIHRDDVLYFTARQLDELAIAPGGPGRDRARESQRPAMAGLSGAAA